ncbi:Flp family type IVb pilin [Rubrivivax sp. JA1024]|nr:Flp family type IVb pilin [Rubrivivax sp. JA1024]
MKHTLQKFWKDETGATAIEYGLIAAGIALAIITIVQTIGGTLNSKFTELSGKLTGATAGGGGAGN